MKTHKSKEIVNTGIPLFRTPENCDAGDKKYECRKRADTVLIQCRPAWAASFRDEAIETLSIENYHREKTIESPITNTPRRVTGFY